jgi:hypothetical protein
MDIPPRSSQRKLIITVHGIRTFGNWQGRLERLLPKDDARVWYHYTYGYLSILGFVVPFVRWLIVRQFRESLLKRIAAHKDAQVYLVGHSFGTHLIGWALLGIKPSQRPVIHTIILAGSVLKIGFPWRDLMDEGTVGRVVNDCGTKDWVLLLNQMCVLFTGMAGRVGFVAMTDSRRFVQRFFPFGHSGYFESVGGADDSFMRAKWLPLLLSEADPEVPDRNRPTTLDGVTLFMINNADPIKLMVASIIPLTLFFTYYGLYQREKTAKEQERIAREDETRQRELAQKNERIARSLSPDSRKLHVLGSRPALGQ